MSSVPASCPSCRASLIGHLEPLADHVISCPSCGSRLTRQSSGIRALEVVLVLSATVLAVLACIAIVGLIALMVRGRFWSWPYVLAVSTLCVFACLLGLRILPAWPLAFSRREVLSLEK